VATGEPGKAAASDNLLSPVHPRPDATGAERTGFLARLPSESMQLQRLNLNLPTALIERLRNAAKTEDRTQTVILGRALRAYLDKNHPEPDTRTYTADKRAEEVDNG